MTVLARDVVDAVRLLHPAFGDARTPRGLILRQLSMVQRLMVQKGTQIDPNVFARALSVILAFNTANVPGAAGAGGGGGLPGVSRVDGDELTDTPAGALFELLTGEDQPVLVSNFVPTSSTETTIGSAGAGWAVDAFAGKVGLVVAGTGYGSVVEILSNTDELLTLDPEQCLSAPLDGTSIVRVIAGDTGAPGNVLAFTALPALRVQKGWLVKYDSQGVPYIDLDSPLLANVAQGVPLVPNYAILGGTVRLSGNGTPMTYPFSLTPYGSRLNVHTDRYCGYVQGGELHLIGSQPDWQAVTSIDLRVVPVPPDLLALTDPLMIDEGGRDALIYFLAERLGRRLTGLAGGVTPDQFQLMQQDSREFMQAWEDSIGRSNVADTSFVDEVV